jgi:hypothetical protein
MPVKTWEPPPDQQDRARQLRDRRSAELRHSDRAMRGADANDDVASADDLSLYGGEDINMHGSER